MNRKILNKEEINKIKAIAFDLDGTVYFGNTLADGVAELTIFLKNRGIKVFYFTNNSAKSREDIFNKLKELGLELLLDEVYNSAYATAIYAKENGFRKVYCVGSKGLIKELELRGITVLPNEEQAEAVIVGLDMEFDYNKIAKALNGIKKGCRLIACNRDRNYPVGNNAVLPGCGPLVAAIEYASGIEADCVIGKPNTYMLELLAKDHRLRNDEILVVGDTYDSDIEMAKRYKSPSILILNNSVYDVCDTMLLNETKDLKSIF